MIGAVLHQVGVVGVSCWPRPPDERTPGPGWDLTNEVCRSVHLSDVWLGERRSCAALVDSNLCRELGGCDHADVVEQAQNQNSPDLGGAADGCS